MDLSIGQQAELKLYPNRKFQLAVVVTQLIVLLSFLVLDIDIIRRHLLFEAVVFSLLLPVGVLVCGIWVHSFVRPTPTVTIDRRGLTYTVGLNHIRLIPWEDIHSIYPRGTGSRSSLLVDVKKNRNGRSKYLRSKEFACYQQQDLHLSVSQILQYIRETYSEELREHGVHVL